eukprot:CAMPEP_0114989294 /NCGR_PEP_ID=MMETSP0216-20121206/10113_1 /TAXON_ID=223996 /ORGANISM="Protocruzia adherens, Strain Boccale" /LENGTH=240 /DNA_ID=CAMNT_0002352247 /DNA_START=401 /DNA_END=1123 /DNA_ORIENTATION=+
MESTYIAKTLGFSKESKLICRDGSFTTVGYIVMELCERGELFEFFSHGPFGEDVVRTFFKQILTAILHCHDQGFAHRDVKPENILLDSYLQVKLTDFGLAYDLTLGAASDRAGTRQTMAPEVLAEKLHETDMADIYSLGILLFAMVFLRYPFGSAETQDELYSHILKDEWNVFWGRHCHRQGQSPREISSEFKDLFQRMTTLVPEERPTAWDLFSHPWFTGNTVEHEDLHSIVTNDVARM